MRDENIPEKLLGFAASLHEEGSYGAALEIYSRLKSACSSMPCFWNNMANSLLETGRFEEAASAYRQALSLDESLDDTRIALATALQARNMIDDAMEQCDKVLSRSPNHAEAHWNRALLLLLQGEYREGWSEYEWRWKKRRFSSIRRDFKQPLWDGSDISGKTILVHSEQGFGDTLQFCRYLPRLAGTGATVLFECHGPLVPLLESLDSRIRVFTFGSPLPDFDLHIPLLSLPNLFETTLENMPDSVPYLAAPAARIPFWESVLPSATVPRFGLCWAGKRYPDPGRSIPAEMLAPFDRLGARWISLQAGETHPGQPHFHPLDLSTLILDFADTAAIISLLDLVVTIDTSVAHLSGSMGKETLLLVPFAPDWRWMLERTDSPWYPSMTIFRQESPDDWGSAVAKTVDFIMQKPRSSCIERGRSGYARRECQAV